MEKKKTEMTVFQNLNSVNVSSFTEERNGLTYLSWSNAWEEVVSRYPDANYEIVTNEKGLPYFEDEKFGIMCYTKVTIEGVTRLMWLPVMDSANNAMKSVDYDFSTFSKYGEKKHHVNAASMFDINKTIMRCLTKNLAMFGLGLYIYKGEDLPTEEKNAKAAEEAAKAEAAEKAKKEEQAKLISEATAKVNAAQTPEEVKKIFASYPTICGIAEFKNLVISKGTALKNAIKKEGAA